MSFRFLSLGAGVLVTVLGGSAIRAAHAQGTTVTQSGGAVTTDCAGGDATVNGSGNAVTFRNACRTLTVNGSGNTIQIELKSAGVITLNGAGNRVSYAPVGGPEDAAITDHGQGNTVAHVAALASGTTTITGGAAALGGLSIRGANGESVQVGPNGVVAVPVPGTGKAVTIAPGGIGVAPGSAAVAAEPGQLMLSGDGQSRDMACSGANVYISGDNGRFTLRGGCKALYIRGDHDIIHVELMPDAQIGIQGDNSLVYFLLTATGPSPTLLVTGENSRAFLVQHIDDTTGTEVPASLRRGALPGAAGALATGAGDLPATILTPQAALAFARGQSVVACGAAAPMAPNALPDGGDNPEGRQQNRRVEVLLQ